MLPGNFVALAGLYKMLFARLIGWGFPLLIGMYLALAGLHEGLLGSLEVFLPLMGFTSPWASCWALEKRVCFNSWKCFS